MLKTDLKPHLKYAFTICFHDYIFKLREYRKNRTIIMPTKIGIIDDDTMFTLRTHSIVHPIPIVKAIREQRKYMLVNRKYNKSIIVFWG